MQLGCVSAVNCLPFVHLKAAESLAQAGALTAIAPRLAILGAWPKHRTGHT